MILDQSLRLLFILAIGVGVFIACHKFEANRKRHTLLLALASGAIAFGGAFLGCYDGRSCEQVVLLLDNGFLGFGRAYVGGLGVLLGCFLSGIYFAVNKNNRW